MSALGQRVSALSQGSGIGYEPIVKLGSGGMASAWLCRAVGVGAFERLVVIKRPHPHVIEKHEAIPRFMEEARLTGSIHHANVVGTHHVGMDDRGPFIVLEYIEGASLEQLLDQAKGSNCGIPVPIALRLILDALAGVQAIHAAKDHAGRPLNIIHRDISLQNLLVGVDGVCRIADFGAAKSDLRDFTTDKNYLLGKLLYVPAEYLRRDEIGPTLDIYSLGITLWHLLTGCSPWHGQSEAQVVACILKGKVPKVSEHALVPPAVDELVAKATRRDPAQRFQSAESMAAKIEAIGRHAGHLATHSEVARFVKTHMQPSLDQRRQYIAGAKARPKPRIASAPATSTPVTSTPVRGASALSASTVSAPAVSPEAVTQSVQRSPARRRPVWLMLASMLSVTAAAGLVAVVRHGGDDSSEGDVIQQEAATSDPTKVSAKGAGASAPAVAPALVAASASSSARVAESEPAQPAPEQADASSASVPRRASSTKARRATKRASRPPAKTSLGPVAAPDRVTTKNPYR